MNKPLISIIIPTYNRADLLPETLDSVLNQTYKNWECIVVDDGSVDETAGVMKQYCEKDSRIQFHQRPPERNPGGNGARNYGFLVSKGKYVKWLDSDDLLTADIVEKEISKAESENADLAFSHWIYFDTEKSVYSERNKLTVANPKNGIELLNGMGSLGEFNYPSCYLVRRDLLTISGLWNEDLRVNQDGEFFFRVVYNSKKLAVVNALGTLHRKDAENKVSQKNDQKTTEMRIRSWMLIESHVLLSEQYDLSEYLNNTKFVLYNGLKKNNDWNGEKPMQLKKSIFSFSNKAAFIICSKAAILQKEEKCTLMPFYLTEPYSVKTISSIKRFTLRFLNHRYSTESILRSHKLS